MTEGPRRFAIRHCFASNVDGDRHMVVDAEDADMSGWVLRTVDHFGSPDDSEFAADQMWGSPGQFSFLGYGDLRPVWIALSQWGTQRAKVVDPNGSEYEVFGD